MINLIFLALIFLASFLLFLEMKVNKKQQKLIEKDTAALDQLKKNNLLSKSNGMLYYRNTKSTNSQLSSNYPGNSSSAA